MGFFYNVRKQSYTVIHYFIMKLAKVMNSNKKQRKKEFSKWQEKYGKNAWFCGKIGLFFSVFLWAQMKCSAGNELQNFCSDEKFPGSIVSSNYFVIASQWMFDDFCQNPGYQALAQAFRKKNLNPWPISSKSLLWSISHLFLQPPIIVLLCLNEYLMTSFQTQDIDRWGN